MGPIKTKNWQPSWKIRPAGCFGKCVRRPFWKKKKKRLLLPFFHRGRTLNMFFFTSPNGLDLYEIHRICIISINRGKKAEHSRSLFSLQEQIFCEQDEMKKPLMCFLPPRHSTQFLRQTYLATKVIWFILWAVLARHLRQPLSVSSTKYTNTVSRRRGPFCPRMRMRRMNTLVTSSTNSFWLP